MAIVFKLQSQGTGAEKLELAKQVKSEKEAETEQLFPFAVRSGTLKLKGELKGGFKVIEVPHAVMVSVPVLGGLLKIKVPSRLYRLLEHCEGTALILCITQVIIPQATGAAKFVLAEQLSAEEKVAVTVQLAPSAVKSVNE